MMILDLNRKANGSDLLISANFGFWPIDTFLNQYLLSLGEFASLEKMEEGS